MTQLVWVGPAMLHALRSLRTERGTRGKLSAVPSTSVSPDEWKKRPHVGGLVLGIFVGVMPGWEERNGVGSCCAQLHHGTDTPL